MNAKTIKNLVFFIAFLLSLIGYWLSLEPFIVIANAVFTKNLTGLAKNL